MVRLWGVVALMLLAVPVQAADLVIYSGRSKGLVQPMVEAFEAESGLSVDVRYGDTSQLAVALMEEGDKSPADVFWAQDAGALGAVAKADLFRGLPKGADADRIPAQFRNPSGLWVATSARARVLAYSTERLTAEDLPTSIQDLTDPKWSGRVGWAPGNASFQSFVTAMRVLHGDEATLSWLTAMKKNGAKAYPKNTPIIQALAAGDIDLGLPNHYYLLRFKTSDSKYPVDQTFFASGDAGNLVNVAGVGILKSTRQRENAEQFVKFLLSPAAQQYFASEVLEYPVIPGVIVSSRLVQMDALLEAAPALDLGDLDDLEGTLDLMRQAGIL